MSTSSKHHRLEPIVEALCHTHATQADSNALLAAPYADVVDFVLKTVDDMPDYLQWGIRLTTGLFKSYGFLRTGRLYAYLPMLQQQNLIREWRRVPLQPCRDWVRFLESLTVLALYNRIAHP